MATTIAFALHIYTTHITQHTHTKTRRCEKGVQTFEKSTHTHTRAAKQNIVKPSMVRQGHRSLSLEQNLWTFSIWTCWAIVRRAKMVRFFSYSLSIRLSFILLLFISFHFISTKNWFIVYVCGESKSRTHARFAFESEQKKARTMKSTQKKNTTTTTRTAQHEVTIDTARDGGAQNVANGTWVSHALCILFRHQFTENRDIVRIKNRCMFRSSKTK